MRSHPSPTVGRVDQRQDVLRRLRTAKYALNKSVSFVSLLSPGGSCPCAERRLLLPSRLQATMPLVLQRFRCGRLPQTVQSNTLVLVPCSGSPLFQRCELMTRCPTGRSSVRFHSRSSHNRDRHSAIRRIPARRDQPGNKKRPRARARRRAVRPGQPILRRDYGHLGDEHKTKTRTTVSNSVRRLPSTNRRASPGGAVFRSHGLLDSAPSGPSLYARTRRARPSRPWNALPITAPDTPRRSSFCRVPASRCCRECCPPSKISAR